MIAQRESATSPLYNPARAPILYSFRRCPYAIRARMVIEYACIKIELREVLLRDKPPEMLTLSPKGTVPILLLPNQVVIDESMDIIRWALAQHDPNGWSGKQHKDQERLIDWNDGEFKYYLDRYKYADRYPTYSKQHYRQKCSEFLIELQSKLERTRYLCGDTTTMTDIAIFPFVRQFAGVDMTWFQSSFGNTLITWLRTHVESELFKNIMTKYQPWISGADPIFMPYKD